MNFKRAIPAACIALFLAALIFAGNFKIAASIFNPKYFQKPYEAVEHIKSNYTVSDSIAVVGNDDFALYLFRGDYSGAFLYESNCVYVADMEVKSGCYMFTGGINGVNPDDIKDSAEELSLKKAKRENTVIYWDIITPQLENKAFLNGKRMNSVRFFAEDSEGQTRELLFIYQVETKTHPERSL